MIYKLIIFFLFLGIPLGVFAITASQKGAILENYKKKQYDLLFESDLGDFSTEYGDIFNISKKVNVYSNIGQKIADQKDVALEKSIAIQEEIYSLEESIVKLDRDIEAVTKKVDTINRNVITTKQDIANTKQQLDFLQKKIIENREILLKYLEYIYKKQQNVYSQTQIDNIKSILLNNQNISDLINDLYFKGVIQVTGKSLIDKHRQLVSELYTKRNDLEKQEEILKKLRKNAIVQAKILNDKKDFKKQILTESKGKQSLYQNYINAKIAAERNIKVKQIQERIKFKNIQKKILEKYGCSFVDMSKNTIETRSLEGKCRDINKMIYNESRVSKIGDSGQGNFFQWPVQPYYGISAFFHDYKYQEEYGSLHDAIDIPVNQGTLIKAPADGYVIHLSKPNTQDYAYIAIKHANGYITVYGHVSEILVDEFEYIYEGQVFAKTGGEFGTNGAGFMTSGPHLHLEVFKDQEYLDPLTQLDLSHLSYEKLPEKYRSKFYIDFRHAKGYEYKNKSDNSKVFSLDGQSEVERQKSLIDKYAVGSFRDWNMWVEESLDGNIDPTFVMCIALAETGMGKNLKSPYNIGNVGNNDRGDTKGYKSARDGVYWIIRTLNNKYFKDINDISYLSGAGRLKMGHPSCKEQGEFCYATDTNHWHKNIVKCMTAIKARYIPDNFNFRVEQK